MKKLNTDNITTQELSAMIDSYIFSTRDREMLKSRYIDGLTFDELSEKYGFSVQHTKTIIYRAFDKLSKRLKI